jgi:hypothetical protein
MNEHIAAFILLDEPETFLLIEPLYFTFWHRLHPPFLKNPLSRIRIMTESKQAAKIRKKLGGRPHTS